MEHITKAWDFAVCENAMLTGADGADAASVFRKAPICSIVKESLQNSIDALAPGNDGPVIVEFSCFNLPKNQFPDYEYLSYAIQKSKEYAVPDGNSQKENFYKAAEECIAKEEILFLRISDRNTTGLVGVNADIKDPVAKKNSKWLHLVRGMGMSNKGNGEGGSHGKGKSAAIANSLLSTLFYSTYAQDEQRGFAGVSFLSTFVDDSPEKNLHLGTGYYCINDGKCTPIPDCISLDPSYLRSEYGTDIYIAGFANEHNWEKHMLICVLNEFLLAVYMNKVEVRLPSYLINAEKLPDLMKEYRKICDELEVEEKENYADICWAAINESENLSDNETISYENMEITLKLYLIKGGKSTKVDMIRQKGMRIQAYTGRKPVPITGCLYIFGDTINRYLAGLEDETHSEWQPKRAGKDNSPEVKQAERVIRKIKGYISKKIDELFETSSGNSLEAEGVEDYFPVDLDNGEGNNTLDAVQTGSIVELPLKPYKPAKSSPELDYLEKKIGTEPYPTEDHNPEDNTTEPVDVPGPNPEPGPGPGPNPPGPDPDPLVHEERSETLIELDKANATKPPKPIKLVRNKLIGKGQNGEYTLAICVDQNCAAFIHLNLSGEEAKEKARILRAATQTNPNISVAEGIIGPVELTGGKLEKISVTLVEKLRCSWEVKVIAY